MSIALGVAHRSVQGERKSTTANNSFSIEQPNHVPHRAMHKPDYTMRLKSIYKQRNVFLLCITFMVLGLFFRSYHIIKYSIQSRDSYVYKEDFFELQENRLQSKILHPLGSVYLMSLPNRWFGLDIFRGGIIVNIILGISIIALVIKICYNITKSSCLMICAGFLTASNSNLIYYSTQFLRETSYLFFICVVLEILTRKEKDSLFKTFLLSFYTMCAIFCRLEGIEIIVFYTILKASTFLFDKHKTGGVFVRLIVNYVLYLVFMILLFLALGSTSFGEFFPLHRVREVLVSWY